MAPDLYQIALSHLKKANGLIEDSKFRLSEPTLCEMAGGIPNIALEEIARQAELETTHPEIFEEKGMAFSSTWLAALLSYSGPGVLKNYFAAYKPGLAESRGPLWHRARQITYKEEKQYFARSANLRIGA